MTTVSPKRVSIYDFLFQDLQPIVSLLADAAQLSLPQARLGLAASLQAIVTALLAYDERHQTLAVHKKLLTRGAVKELRQYSAMNFTTISVSLHHRNDVTNTLFGDSATVMQACAHIAAQIKTSPAKSKVLLTSVSLIVLRELAILADYSQLDNDELDKWFKLQPQFLQSAVFDPYWYELTQFQPAHNALSQDDQQDKQLATTNSLKARVLDTEDDLLTFTPMANITLPQQRWLLQLAETADIYLNGNPLRITSEPPTAPIAPLVSLGLLSANSEDTLLSASEQLIAYDTSVPLWKNPVILIIILVISGLGALAMLKYQQQQSAGVLSASDAVYEHDNVKEHEQQDVKTLKTGNESITITNDK